MRTIEDNIISKLKEKGADFVRFVDITGLPTEKTRGYPVAVIFGLALTPGYIKEVSETPDYVKARYENNYDFDDDLYLNTEILASRLSDELAEYIREEGYSAYSQSDENQIETTDFTHEQKETLLPHKTIAVLGGVGWIGNNNLLITSRFGCGLCMGSVLTDASLQTVRVEPLVPRCGNCTVCRDICEPGVLTGMQWRKGIEREKIIDVHRCLTCLKCLVHCPWTQRVIKKEELI